MTTDAWKNEKCGTCALCKPKISGHYCDEGPYENNYDWGTDPEMPACSGWQKK